MPHQKEDIYDLSNGATFGDLEWPLTTVITRACHYSMLNISGSLQDRHIVTMEY